MSTPLITLPCPKCAAPMRTLERSGIHLEMCPECRGIFLDRGELDRLIDLEAAGTWPTASAAPAPDRASRDGGHDRRGRWHDDEDAGGRPGQRGSSARRRGLFGELFEGFGD